MNKKRIFILCGALLGFLSIAFAVINAKQSGIPLAFDTIVRSAIIGCRNPLLNPLLIAITYLGNSLTIVFFCIILLFFKGTRMNYGFPLSIAASCSATIQTIIKWLIQRPRPPVENFLISQGGFSFPSGHSCSGLVFYGLFAYLLFHTPVDKSVYKVLGTGCILLFLCIGISRIYVGVHYPSDVMGGWLLGLAIWTVAVTVVDKFRKGERREPRIGDKESV
ncbi:phosphatase PAP2 family protein [Aminipila butyrica]|uniref:Phosphatase PAP2 family protein n=1 Tax=Aminipila butyrica TaxID=433296 RepID=A0A858BSM2_9FIRM|nr:phosphatase PAP2 family protein [Aminipila butyrica]QIB67940.1 phosphatase PAP2 family protein [Aminipila butyrica]